MKPRGIGYRPDEKGQDSRNDLPQGSVQESLCWTRLRCVQRGCRRVFEGCRCPTASLEINEKSIAYGGKPTARATAHWGVEALRIFYTVYNTMYKKMSASPSSRLENRFSITKVCFLSRRLVVILIPVTRGLPLILKLNIQGHVWLVTILVACVLL